jgi:hypothetical protein
MLTPITVMETPPLVGKLLRVTLTIDGEAYAKRLLTAALPATGLFNLTVKESAVSAVVWQNFGYNNLISVCAETLTLAPEKREKRDECDSQQVTIFWHVT